MRSQRLTYRPIDARDASRIAVLAGDWDIARMTARIPHPYSLVDADQWISSIESDEFVRAVERDGELIGAVGYIQRDAEQAEIGYWIGKPWWGNGYATEAASALMDFCFGEAGFKRLTCGHFIDNSASARVIKKLGFRRVGSDQQWCEARKSEVPTIRYVRRRPWLGRLWRGGKR
ncbi:GNAT family N-acetyltransferase [Hyphomicrobium sp. NDB2Meth4]|uniref:GNAT family N-acetyltransferase n=1 Tax=Hyphomicrobium sp. NDB2Meth4 TaxID=1892846 RepID=UPI0009301CD3|nr:GNAT family N-acetyltransferase [Hyphomicrobium sp. NDB2Meth4]